MEKEVIDVSKYMVKKEEKHTRDNGFMWLIVGFIIVVIVVLVFFYFRGFEFWELGFFKGSNLPEELNSSLENISLQVNNESVIDISNESVEDEMNDSDNDDFPNSEEAHWGHMPLSYKINDKGNCEGTPFDNIIKAFKSVEDVSGGSVSFIELDFGDGDIEVNCIDGAVLLNETKDDITCEEKSFDYDKKYIDVVREGLIQEGDYLVNVTEVSRNITINFTEVIYDVCYIDSGVESIASLKESKPEIENSLILGHNINIYKSGPGWNICADFPAREVHEILHGFGFEHSEEPGYDPYYGWANVDSLKDVMFSTLFCKYQKQIDEKYASCLGKIYSGKGDCSGVVLVK